MLVQTPVYNIFFNSIVNNGRNIVESLLQYDGNTYHMDFEDLEQKLSNPQTTLMILCNPHNPVGRIWNREELGRVGDLCRKHHVIVISDEIHCDLTSPGQEYIPFASVSENCRKCSITCIAPTKAFNLAGLQTAAVAVPDPFLRHKVWRWLNTDEVAEPNSFAVEGAVAAFTKGEAWLDALREYIQENKKYADEISFTLGVAAVFLCCERVSYEEIVVRLPVGKKMIQCDIRTLTDAGLICVKYSRKVKTGN
ncbi:Cystathionine beta-lyase PatB [Acetatifactor muris]|uniref:cysteine-S-conjugate beta-lyase n=1 Tax=Acetatifactor muris TaxID=879566 RepID=A0A2K4ZIR4_9FIRM|nr:aminotransferase class I/II-fold pyridoxal phosphate-dependent enzyme [Acetatifactor muris]SOY30368.1 Cystathionine beta-lyase PatB [Acetatifactor muris]